MASASRMASTVSFARHPFLAEFCSDVVTGLSHPGQKELPSKYLYDETGSALFEAICLLPEYGLGRAETRILRRHADEIVARLPQPVIVAELGSGSAQKTRWLLEGLSRRTANSRSAIERARVRYHPIDISGRALWRCHQELAHLDGISIVGYERAYLDGLREVAGRRDGRAKVPSGGPGPERAAPIARTPDHHHSESRCADLRRVAGTKNLGAPSPPPTSAESLLVLFLGSTIGNFDRPAGEAFLREIRSILRPGDALLLAADLEKPVPCLIAAYDDPIGLTAAFNKNLLARLNRELFSDFDLRRFAHEVRYDPAERRVEMHLRSLAWQRVAIGAAGFAVQLRQGETIWTESSHKYDPAEVVAMGERAGFRSAGQWLDHEWAFAETLLFAE